MVQIVEKPGDDRAALLAQTYLRPTVQNAATVRVLNMAKGDNEPELMALIGELGKQVAAVNDGDMKRAEGMLISQAHTLDAIFGCLTRRALNQEYLKQYETYMRLALKAQSQCRATLTALAEIKNPRALAFVQQTNIANGPQQVLNDVERACGHAESRETEIPQNELLRTAYEKPMDYLQTQAASITDTSMATMAEINRPAVTGGESACCSERI